MTERRYRLRLFYTAPKDTTRHGFDTEASGTTPRNAAHKVLRRLRKKFPQWKIVYTGISRWMKEEA